MQERMDGLYDEMDALELSIEEVHLYGKATDELDWDNESTVESVVKLERR